METEANTAGARKCNWKKIGLILFGVIVVLFFAVGAFADDILKWDASRRAENYDEMLAESRAEYNKALAADTYGGATPEETLDLLIAALEKNDIALVVKYYPVNTQKEVAEKYATRTELDITSAKSMLIGLKNNGIKTCVDSGCVMRGTIKNEELSFVVNFSLNPVTKIWKIENPY